MKKISEDRLRNTRAWAEARIGQLYGAEVIVCAIDELLQLRSSSESWQPIETAPKDEEAIFWITPLTAGDRHFCDTSGSSILLDVEPRRFVGMYGRWSSLMKAVLWHPLPLDPGAVAQLGDHPKKHDEGHAMFVLRHVLNELGKEDFTREEIQRHLSGEIQRLEKSGASGLEFYAVVTEKSANAITPDPNAPYLLTRIYPRDEAERMAEAIAATNLYGWARVARVTVLE